MVPIGLAAAFFLALDPFVVGFVWFLGIVALVVLAITHRGSPVPPLLFLAFWTGVVLKTVGFG